MTKSKLFIILIILVSLTTIAPAYAGDRWLGTDDLVDAKMKEMAGVTASAPIIDISQGNLGLFIFTLGGFAAGTIFGYNWRRIFSGKAGR